MIRDSIGHIHDRWANLPHIVRFLLLAAVVGVVGIGAGRPAWHQFRQWRMERNLENAKAALGEERMQEAKDLSLTVLRAGDPRVEAIRVLERSTAFLKDPRHSEIARALIVHPEGTDEDRLTGFRGLVDRIPLGLVGQAWVSLPENCRKDARFAQAFAGRLIMEQRLGEATSVLLAVPADQRDAACERALVRVLIDSGRREGFQEAQKRIADALPSAGSERAGWLELLETIPPVSLEAALLAPVNKCLTAKDSATEGRNALMVARIDYASRFAERVEIIEKAIETWEVREPVELARFLKSLGLHGRMLETFPNERIATNPGLFPLLMEASGNLGDWVRMKSLVDENAFRMSRLEELGYRAVLAEKTTADTTAAEAWSAAMREASGGASDDAFLKLSRMAREAGMTAKSNEAMLAAIRTGRGPLPHYSALSPLVRFLAEQGQERAILEVAATYLSFEAGNPVLITQYAYLACLNDLVEPAAVIQALEPMAKVMPKEVPLQCAMAMAYLFDAKPGKASEVLEPLALDAAKLPPQFRTIVLVTRLLNGSITKNDAAIRDIPWESLLPSERAKFGSLVRNAGL